MSASSWPITHRSPTPSLQHVYSNIFALDIVPNNSKPALDSPVILPLPCEQEHGSDRPHTQQSLPAPVQKVCEQLAPWAGLGHIETRQQSLLVQHFQQLPLAMLQILQRRTAQKCHCLTASNWAGPLESLTAPRVLSPNDYNSIL